MRVNFCIFNHLDRGITDQIWFVETLFREKGWPISITKTLDPYSLNLVLENFSRSDREIIETFCKKRKKSIGLIMSEHIELVSGRIRFNGGPLNDREYIGNKEERFFESCSLLDYVHAVFTLGELPKLETFNTIAPTHKPYRLPYPRLEPRRRSEVAAKDLIFTGALTPYRKRVLADLGSRYSVMVADHLAVVDPREAAYALGNVALNVPQNKDWIWTSPMRVLYGLRVGVPTFHYGSLDDSLFSEVMRGASLEELVRQPLAAWEDQFLVYDDLVRSDHNPVFPESLFRVWGELENIY